jgi:hypothetical protein
LFGIIGLALITFAAVPLHLQPGATSLLLFDGRRIRVSQGWLCFLSRGVAGSGVLLNYYFLPLFSSPGTKHPRINDRHCRER